MKTSTKNSGLKVKTSVKGGIWPANHNQAPLAGKQAGLVVRSKVKAGICSYNHSHAVLR
jgi:hypothetical protein